MEKIKDVMAYLLLKHPDRRGLPMGHLVKMLYLADWRHVLTDKKQITASQWVFNSFGPYTQDVMRVVDSNHDLFSSLPESVLIVDRCYIPNLIPSEQAAIDHVITVTKNLTWSAFTQLVYSTYPIVACNRYADLDLCKLASEYQALMPNPTP